MDVKPSRCHLNQVIRANTISKGTNRSHMSPGQMQWENTITSVWFPCQKPESNHEETSVKPKWRNVPQIVALKSSKVSRTRKLRKDWRTVPDWKNNLNAKIFLLEVTLLGELANLKGVWGLDDSPVP